MHWRETKSLAELEASYDTGENQAGLFDQIHLNIKSLDPSAQARFFTFYSTNGTIPKKYLDQINDTHKSHIHHAKRRSRKFKEQPTETQIQPKQSKFLNKYFEDPLNGLDDPLFNDFATTIRNQRKFKNELSISNQIYQLALQRFRKYYPEISENLPKSSGDSYIDDNENERLLKNFKISQKLIESSIAILVENSDNIPLDFQQDIPHNISTSSFSDITTQDNTLTQNISPPNPGTIPNDPIIQADVQTNV